MQLTNERRKLWGAIIASIFIHLVVAFSLAGFGGGAAAEPLADEEKPPELTLVDLSPVAPPLVPRNPSYLETNPSKESVEAPKEQTFESNANSVAASTLPASGDAPLPSQEGKNRPLNLETHSFSLPTEGAQPQTQSTALPIPTPKPSVASKPSPKPSEAPKPTPTPVPVSTPEPEQFAMLTSTPPPAISPPDERQASPTPETAPSPELSAARPQPEQPSSAYQAEKEQTRVSGRITNRGASAVNAVGTPLGRYTKQVHDAIGSRWYYYTKQRGDLISIGTAQLTFSIDRAGHVANLKLAGNTSNEAFANVCLESVQEIKVPPIPEELAQTLPPEGLQEEITFTMYGNQ